MATGAKPENIGLPIDRLKIDDHQELEIENNICRAKIVSIDHFGNIIFALSKADLKHWKKAIKLVTFKNFSSDIIWEYYSQQEKGKPLVLWNSKDMLEIALSQGRAEAYFKPDVANDFAIIELMDIKKQK